MIPIIFKCDLCDTFIDNFISSEHDNDLISIFQRYGANQLVNIWEKKSLMVLLFPCVRNLFLIKLTVNEEYVR